MSLWWIAAILIAGVIVASCSILWVDGRGDELLERDEREVSRGRDPRGSTA
jgi:hypothetical protein